MLKQKDYISYSQLSTLEYSEESYRQKYIHGVQKPDSPYLILGKFVDEALQHREIITDNPILEKIKHLIPNLPIKQYEAKAKLDKIKLLGYYDQIDKDNLILADDKTGKKKNMKGWTSQICFYNLIWFLSTEGKNRKMFKENYIHWLQTEFNEDGVLVLTGHYETIKIKITLKDLMLMIKRIQKADKRIKELWEIENYMFGKVDTKETKSIKNNKLK